MKEDNEPTLWGECNMEQLKKINSNKGASQKNRIHAPTGNHWEISPKKDVLDIYEDEILKAKILAALPRMKEAYDDLKTIKMMRETVLERIQT